MKSPGNLFLKKGTNPVRTVQAVAILHIFKVDHLKYEHEKLQKKSNKQTTHIEKERDKVGFQDFKMVASTFFFINFIFSKIHY